MTLSVAFLLAVLLIVALSMLGLPVGHAMIGGSTGKLRRFATIAISSICAMPIISPGMMPPSSR